MRKLCGIYKKTPMFRQFFILVLIFFFSNAFSQTDQKKDKASDTLKGLQNDIYLHPLNSNTAYTLKKGECVYNQAPASLPLPSWGWVGITDWLTAEIDF